MDSVYETLLNRLLEEVKNEDIKKGINIALSAYMDSGYMNYNDMYNDELMDETVDGYLQTLGEKEYKHMARGTMYELQREKDFLNQLQEEELYEHLPDIAEFVKTEKNKEGAVCILLEEMQELGAVVGKEDDISYIIFTKECKENYFRDRFAKVKKIVADMDLDEFSNSDLFTLRDTIQDNWGDMAYEDSMIPFDQFIRTAIPDAKYYIGNIIYLH